MFAVSNIEGSFGGEGPDFIMSIDLIFLNPLPKLVLGTWSLVAPNPVVLHAVPIVIVESRLFLGRPCGLICRRDDLL